MSEWIKVTAVDGHELAAYVAKPEGEAVGAVVVLMEIYGVNAAIRQVADKFAKDGFVAIAPALFDREERNVELGYGPEDQKKAFELYGKVSVDDSVKDTAACFAWAKEQTGKAVGVVGFCRGGLLAWLAATRGENFKMQPACTVGYYAGGIGKVANEEPACPVMLHFGGADDHIGADQREAVAKAHPEVEIFVYDGAGHAFANSFRPSFKEDPAKVADARTLDFLKKHIA